MAEANDRQWLRNLFVIPLIVGVITAGITFLLPLIFKDKNELTYTIEGPIQYLKDLPSTDVTIEIKGIKTPAIYGYITRILNSGNKPLKQVSISLVFSPEDQGFRILSVQHTTKPEREFSGIASYSDSEYVRRFVYEYLNPGNEDVITLLSTKPLNLMVYSNPEGVSVKQAQGTTQISFIFSGFAARAAVLVSILAAFMSTLLTYYIIRGNKKT